MGKAVTTVASQGMTVVKGKGVKGKSRLVLRNFPTIQLPVDDTTFSFPHCVCSSRERAITSRKHVSIQW